MPPLVPLAAPRCRATAFFRPQLEALEQRWCPSAAAEPLPPAEPTAEPSASNFRWASSSNTIYVTGPVTVTLTDIDTFLPKAPLDLVDADQHIWLLRANLKLEQGAKLELHGSEVGGDVDELRLLSNNSAAANSVIWVRVDWGTLEMNSTSVTSWDQAAAGPDLEYGAFKRAYIRARSFLDADGVTARESRMDIIDSDVGYLGYKGAEAYGLSWKVYGSGPDLFDQVNVYGDVIGSRLHHNYFGFYSYGAYGMQILNNEVDHNVQYGIDPHDDSDFLLIEGNHSHSNGNHGIIASKRCNNVIIRNNISENNVGHGIMLHRSSDYFTVENNIVRNNTQAGIAIFESHFGTITGNEVTGNRYGLRFSVGASHNVVNDNDFDSNTSYGVYFFKGSDLPTSGDGRPKFNILTNNRITNNSGYGMKIHNSDDNDFIGNVFSNNLRRGIRFETSVGNLFQANTVPANVTLYLRGTAAVATVVYVSDQPDLKTDVDAFSDLIFGPRP